MVVCILLESSEPDARCVDLEFSSKKRPHRFDRLRERNYKEWDFWMNRCCFDENGTPYGWGKVLDYLGIGWRDIPEAEFAPEQMTLKINDGGRQ